MKSSEPDKVKWFGVRPAHNGEQIFESRIITTTPFTMYTVPSGKILLLYNYFASSDTDATHDSENYIVLRNASNTIIYYFLYCNHTDIITRSACGNFYFPMEIPSDYNIYMYQYYNYFNMTFSFHGVLIDD